MKQTSSLTRKLTAAQERNAESTVNAHANLAVVYRLYTEDNTDAIWAEIIQRYFKGYTLFRGTGVYQGVREQGVAIEIIGSAADLQSIVHLAGDIRQVNNQSSVLVTWNNVSLLNVTGDV